MAEHVRTYDQVKDHLRNSLSKPLTSLAFTFYGKDSERHTVTCKRDVSPARKYSVLIEKSFIRRDENKDGFSGAYETKQKLFEGIQKAMKRRGFKSSEDNFTPNLETLELEEEVTELKTIKVEGNPILRDLLSGFEAPEDANFNNLLSVKTLLALDIDTLDALKEHCEVISRKKNNKKFEDRIRRLNQKIESIKNTKKEVEEHLDLLDNEKLLAYKGKNKVLQKFFQEFHNNACNARDENSFWSSDDGYRMKTMKELTAFIEKYPHIIDKIEVRDKILTEDELEREINKIQDSLPINEALANEDTVRTLFANSKDREALKKDKRFVYEVRLNTNHWETRVKEKDYTKAILRAKALLKDYPERNAIIYEQAVYTSGSIETFGDEKGVCYTKDSFYEMLTSKYGNYGWLRDYCSALRYGSERAEASDLKEVEDDYGLKYTFRKTIKAKEIESLFSTMTSKQLKDDLFKRYKEGSSMSKNWGNATAEDKDGKKVDVFLIG